MTTAFSVETFEARLAARTFGRRLVYEPTVASTMDVARREAEAGCPEGAVVLADEQTAGRGRLGRSWLSPPGDNLYLTVVLRPSPARLRRLSVVSGLAVAEAVERVTGLETRLKWPNDVLVAGKKVAGILIESELAGDEIRFALVGAGINVNLDVSRIEELRDIATSLAAEVGRRVSREELLAALLGRLEELYLAPEDADEPHRLWRERLETLGRSVRVQFGEQVEEGLAEDVAADGSLILRRRDGSVVRIEAGDVTLKA
jgi:BirA family biotin operon repressor/biotin-[acetyl-CoA-carboxylase] ligase